MKTGILLSLWFAITCVPACGQNFSITSIPNDKRESVSRQDSISPHKITQVNKLTRPEFALLYYLQKSKVQKINGLVLITGGSFMSFLGIRSGLDISKSISFRKSLFQANSNEFNTYSRLALTGLVIMAGSIPYFINSLKNKKIAGLKLTCQKTSFGAANKACKKVTGLTFSVPIGYKEKFLGY
ncbi:MAG: hypothetical protein ABI760_04635 [Ferruginibacter sp.]